jgi:hypothetical protein
LPDAQRFVVPLARREVGRGSATTTSSASQPMDHSAPRIASDSWAGPAGRREGVLALGLKLPIGCELRLLAEEPHLEVIWPVSFALLTDRREDVRRDIRWAASC